MIYRDQAQYCPGEVCDIKSKQDIQKISGAQVLIVLGFTTFIILTGVFFNGYFGRQPHDLFGLNSTAQAKK